MIDNRHGILLVVRSLVNKMLSICVTVRTGMISLKSQQSPIAVPTTSLNEEHFRLIKFDADIW